jgi:SOS-response transcriptional repressor LexA
MKPTIGHGLVAIFVRRSNYTVGAIVLATLGGREVVKRIRKIDGDKVWLKGDNPLESTDSDELGPVNINDIKARLLLKL